MDIRKNVPLSQYSTMRLGGPAKFVVEIQDEDTLQDAIGFAQEEQVPFVVVGTGSNIVWTDTGYPGLVIVNRIQGIDVIVEDPQFQIIRFGAGVMWDDAVEYSVQQQLTGIEALSLVPGTCGAAPVQNIGAYGQEIADTLVAVHAYDSKLESFLSLDKQSCEFGYRRSIFNSSQKGRYIITGISLKLFKSKPKPPYYKDIEAYLNEHDIIGPTPAQLREAVLAIRTIKLPDPSDVANNGSFFRNPIVDAGTAKQLLTAYPDMPNWEMNDGRFKLSAAWLIEQAGFPRGTQDAATGMASWKNHAMVLVNQHAKSAQDLLSFRDKIISAVQDKFSIRLEQEPEIIA